jgi:hypothetical protein
MYKKIISKVHENNAENVILSKIKWSSKYLANSDNNGTAREIRTIAFFVPLNIFGSVRLCSELSNVCDELDPICVLFS